MKKQSKLKAIGVDVCAGAGGLSLGALSAGIGVKLAIEVDSNALATYAKNSHDTVLINEPLEKVKRIDIDSKGLPKILFGGLPCQGFSTANQRNRGLVSIQNRLYLDFFRLAKAWQPDCIVIENVKGLIETKGGFFFEDILKHMGRLKYHPTWWILNAADYGVPQNRIRLFIIGLRKPGEVPKPKAKKCIVTVNDAIADLPELNNGADQHWMPYRSDTASKYAMALRNKNSVSPNHLVTRNSELVIDRYSYIPQGGNWKHIPKHLFGDYYKNPEGCHTSIYYRLAANEPSIVIGNFRKSMLIHPVQNRGLSVREAARIQSFPDWYEFSGSIGFQQQQIGNAVPPLMAKAVFETIMKSL